MKNRYALRFLGLFIFALNYANFASAMEIVDYPQYYFEVHCNECWGLRSDAQIIEELRTFYLELLDLYISAHPMHTASDRTRLFLAMVSALEDLSFINGIYIINNDVLSAMKRAAMKLVGDVKIFEIRDYILNKKENKQEIKDPKKFLNVVFEPLLNEYLKLLDETEPFSDYFNDINKWFQLRRKHFSKPDILRYLDPSRDYKCWTFLDGIFDRFEKSFSGDERAI